MCFGLFDLCVKCFIFRQEGEARVDMSKSSFWE